ncbi:hypothetical protein SAMN05216474_0609 [Lishizhenia tianjinensis]|uniref:Lipoprotein n=1 Tax=Lishizhenia tianjinensis TaxID=477690 RepID=A0A1I6Y1Q8_9FLAO|nr:DUF6567 family protein [Lishizhenia tianjinensis]SFT44545.1 hypothetical protein SAMN05216474_0609 [Lishizhenia tianjinensis]
MQINVFKSLFFLLASFSLVSCAVVHRGHIVSLDYGQPVPIEDQAIGTASARYFWGFGGNGTDILLKNAKDNMIKNRPLHANEVYKNINLNVSHAFYPLFSKVTYTITADVIDVTQDPSYPDRTEFTSELYAFGDSLFNYKKEFLGFFIERQANAKVKLQTPKGVIKLISENDFYKVLPVFNNYQMGQEISFESDYFSKGTIKAFGYNRVLVDTEGDADFEIEYTAITNEAEQPKEE